MEENFEPNSNNWNNDNTQASTLNKSFNKKSGKKGLIIAIVIILVLALIIGGIAAWWFLIYNSPKNVFVKNVDKMFETTLEETKYDTIKTTAKMTVEVESDDTEVAAVSALLSLAELNMDIEVDMNNKIMNENISINYGTESIINADLILQDDEIYVFLNDIFSKYLHVSMDAVEMETEDLTETLFETSVTETVVKKIQEALIKELKEQKYTQEKDKIDIDGKTENATKSTLELTEKQFVTMVINICTELKNDEEFMNCFTSEKKELLNKFFDEITEEREDTIANAGNETFLKIDLYTKGLKNEFAKLGITLFEDEETITTIGIQNSKETENAGTLVLTMDMPDENMQVKINCTYKNEYNVKISKTDVTNAVDIDELTNDDILEMYENIEGTLLYDILESMGMDDLLDVSTITDNPEISAYGFNVSYAVPETFSASEYNSEEYKLYYTDDWDSATISIEKTTAEEYLNGLSNSSILDSSFYSNPVLGETQSLTIANNKFYVRELTYSASAIDYKTWYFCTEIYEGYVYVVEITAEIDDVVDVEPFLTIDVRS